MNSLIIGRFQPFHDGHKKLIDTVLSEGKSVVIAIRNTVKDSNNPYTIAQRTDMIKKVYSDRVEIITLPDIEEIVYGRDVGYGIRKIDLDEYTKGISATNIRKGKIWWFFGNSGSGKTTLAKQTRDTIILDGDALRKCWKLGFSKSDRWEQNMRAANIAKMLKDQGKNVVVSTICPYKKLRDEIREMIGCKFVYIEGGVEPSKKYPFEK